MAFYATQRVVRATAATIEWQGVDQNGEPADPGTVTVGVTRADGTTLVAAGTATGGSGTNPRTYALTVADTADLDYLTATWSVSGTVVGRTFVEVVGGVYATTAQIRSMDTVLGDAGQDTPDQLIRARQAAERMFESVTGAAWVPKFEVERIDGTGRFTLALHWPMLRRVRWCRIYTTATTYETLTADQLAAIPADDAGVAVRTDGYVWPVGVSNIEIGYEHGADSPPVDMVEQLVLAIRKGARRFDNGLPEAATVIQFAEGGSATLATPGLGIWVTGIPSVDEMLRSYNRKTPGIA